MMIRKYTLFARQNSVFRSHHPAFSWREKVSMFRILMCDGYISNSGKANLQTFNFNSAVQPRSVSMYYPELTPLNERQSDIYSQLLITCGY